MKNSKGFTLFEVLIGISILGIITAVALPNLSEFLVKMRVDNQISQLQRLLLMTRNAAINAEQNVTICPLNGSNVCTNDWTQDITVFIDVDGDGSFETSDNDSVIKVKQALDSNDKLQFTYSHLTYGPSARPLGNSNATFSYCPTEHQRLSRGIVVFRSGRTYTTRDTDSDGKDENRLGFEISCS